MENLELETLKINLDSLALELQKSKEREKGLVSLLNEATCLLEFDTEDKTTNWYDRKNKVKFALKAHAENGGKL